MRNAIFPEVGAEDDGGGNTDAAGHANKRVRFEVPGAPASQATGPDDQLLPEERIAETQMQSLKKTMLSPRTKVLNPLLPN